jgi:hypothetical protein
MMVMQQTAPAQPADPAVEDELDRLVTMPIAKLRVRYREVFRTEPPKAFGPDLLRRSIAHRIQEKAYGGLSRPTERLLDQMMKAYAAKPGGKIVLPRRIKPGSVLVREWKSKSHRVTVLEDGFVYDGDTYSNLSEIAVLITGTKWNGPRFFGLRTKTKESGPIAPSEKSRPHRSRVDLVAEAPIGSGTPQAQAHPMRKIALMATNAIKPVRCAIYTRKSTEHGLELEFNSLDAQRDACESYIKSQASQGWRALPQHYDDPAYSGGNLDRPALQQLLKDIDGGRIDVIVVYKIDPIAGGLRQAGRGLRCQVDLVRRGHPAVQHHDIDGSIDPECPAVLCSVRAGAVLRAGPRQGRGLKTQGQMDRWHRSPGLRHQGQEAGHQQD